MIFSRAKIFVSKPIGKKEKFPTKDNNMAQPNWHRKCVGCGTARHKKELLRIVFKKNKSLEIDKNQTKQGRGIYICPKLTCAESAKHNHGIERSLRLEIDRSFYQTLISMLKVIRENDEY